MIPVVKVQILTAVASAFPWCVIGCWAMGGTAAFFTLTIHNIALFLVDFGGDE